MNKLLNGMLATLLIACSALSLMYSVEALENESKEVTPYAAMREVPVHFDYRREFSQGKYKERAGVGLRGSYTTRQTSSGWQVMSRDIYAIPLHSEHFKVTIVSLQYIDGMTSVTVHCKYKVTYIAGATQINMGTFEFTKVV